MLDIDKNLLQFDKLSMTSLLLHIVIGFVLALLLRYHFVKLGKPSSNRKDVGNVLPFIVVIVVLIISIVKSSLALSLGLVGALSVIRFRTAIKEPEELAYLFMAIAIGLGLGANQLLATVAATLLILLITAFFTSYFVQSQKIQGSLLLSIATDGESNIEDMSKLLDVFFEQVELKKFNHAKSSTQVLYSVKPKKDFALDLFQQKMQDSYPQTHYSLLDNSHLFGI
ncbi:MAG: DUF4956 domain-containing protein [Bdellovibrionota bacterium]